MDAAEIARQKGVESADDDLWPGLAGLIVFGGRHRRLRVGLFRLDPLSARDTRSDIARQAGVVRSSFFLNAVGQRWMSNDHGERFSGVPDRPVTGTYVLPVTILRVWPFAVIVTFALAIVSVVVVECMAAGEYICFDRSPWWGPPEDPTSTCAGHFYESKHHVPFPQR